ncbi:MAG: hypothetical protein K2Q25_08910 [Mycobacteriaceae bacterium]|nr:hypothetical protein [Mycobacteriaceae bacterium]
MTAALCDQATEVTAVTRGPRLTLVTAPSPAPAGRKVTCLLANQALRAGRDPLIDGAACLLAVPMRQLYATLWRIGLLEVR